MDRKGTVLSAKSAKSEEGLCLFVFTVLGWRECVVGCEDNVGSGETAIL